MVSIFAIDKLWLLSWVLHHGRRQLIFFFCLGKNLGTSYRQLMFRLNALVVIELLEFAFMMAGEFSQNMSLVSASFMAWNEAMYIREVTLTLHTIPPIDYFCPCLALICPMSVLWLRVLSTGHWSQGCTTGEGKLD